VRITWASGDERLLAPPELDEGVQSLEYWRERSRRLPWYRFRLRREAAQMTIRWEQRVSQALLWQRGAHPVERFSAGLLVARTRLGRWGRRARTIPIVAVIVALLHALL
jgi:hypothetical protein